MTIKDIADRAGVAKSTVSRVLNNSGYVGIETRKKIEQVIAETNYLPSAMARSLSKQESRTIGVVIPEADNTFFGEVLRGISEVVDKNNLTMIFCNTENNQSKEQKALRMLQEQRVRGLILTPTADYGSPKESRRLKTALNRLNVPILLLDRKVQNPQWDGIYYDNFGGAYQATEALIQAGHKKIGIITGDLSQFHGRERFRGFKQAIYDAGLSVDPAYIYEGDFTTQKAYELARQMIASGNMPQAVFLSNNLTSLGFIKAIFEVKMRLGKDICCIGFDHVDAFDILNIGFSYVERDTINMGRMAMHMLMDRIAQPDLPRREHIISASLMLRGSERWSE